MAAATASAPALVDFMIRVFTVSPIPGVSGRCSSTLVVAPSTPHPVPPLRQLRTLSHRSVTSAPCPTAPSTPRPVPLLRQLRALSHRSVNSAPCPTAPSTPHPVPPLRQLRTLPSCSALHGPRQHGHAAPQLVVAARVDHATD